MVLFLAFGLVLFPINKMPGEQQTSVTSYAPAIGELNCSRTCGKITLDAFRGNSSQSPENKHFEFINYM